MLNSTDTNFVYKYLSSYRAILLHNMNEINEVHSQFDISEIDRVLNKINTTEIIVKEDELKNIYETQGRISAIKHYRNITFGTLKESKEAVDKLAKKDNWKQCRPMQTY